MNTGLREPVRLADRNYWREQIKCLCACPVNTDARGYIRAIADGNPELAYLIARGPNPLASICGKICGAPCERACRRGDYDEPVSIRRLKNYACEAFRAGAGGGDSGSLTGLLREAAARRAPRQCQDGGELLPMLRSLMDGSVKPVKGKSVGIVGSGPAGLAAAHDLALMGFAAAVYEMEPVLAGMLVTGVPEYRLPRKTIEAEVDAILALGVEAFTGCRVGRDVSFGELRRRHDAVVVAAGAKRSRPLPIPGADAPGVIGGVEYLRDVALGNPPRLEGRVVVIGGGNVAYDVGRTVLRQIAMDAARTALRASGASEVTLCSLESLDEMPADDIEIIEGDEEGIRRMNGLGPQEIAVEGGRVRAVRFKKCLRVFNEAGRFDPIYDECSVTEVECDAVLVAIGQRCELDFVDPARDGLALRPNGYPECDPETGRTQCPDVFIAGDLAHGTKLLIHAVASGKAAARSIYETVTGCRLTASHTELHFPLASYYREPGYEKQSRVEPPKAPVAERLRSQSREVEFAYTREGAEREASRCLDCGVNTIFDGGKCILCGGCADVCPEGCLRIVPLPWIAEGGAAEGVPGAPAAGEACAIVKDETVCIRCGLCAERCPAGAIAMEQFHFEVKLTCKTD